MSCKYLAILWCPNLFHTLFNIRTSYIPFKFEKRSQILQFYLKIFVNQLLYRVLCVEFCFATIQNTYFAFCIVFNLAIQNANGVSKGIQWAFNVSDVFLAYMCITQSGFNLVMPQYFLNKKYGGITFQQVSSKAVPKSMNANYFVYFSIFEGICKHFLHTSGAVLLSILPFKQVFFWFIFSIILTELF